MPVGNNGKFTPEARAIYTLVHEMQSVRLFFSHPLALSLIHTQLAMAAIKPGVHWDTIHLLCHRVLIRGFLRLGLFVSGGAEDEILAAGVSTAFFPHGLGHSLGLDVHDVPSASKPADDDESDPIYRYLRLRLPLQVGMVVVSLAYFFGFIRSLTLAADCRTWDLLLPALACASAWERVRRLGGPRAL